MKQKPDRTLSRECFDLILTPGARAFVYPTPVIILSERVLKNIEKSGGDPSSDIDIDVFAHRALHLWKVRRFRTEGEVLAGVLFECGEYRFQARTMWKTDAEPIISFAVPGEAYPEIM